MNEHRHDHACGCGHDHGEEEPKSLLPLLISGVIFLVGWQLPRLLDMPDFVQPCWMAAAAIWPLLPSW